MPVPLILCRLKDDHEVTQMIGETALIYFQEWEPVPDDEDAPEPSDAKSTEPPKDEPDPDEKEAAPPKDEPVASRKTTRTTTRTKAATSAEKDKE